MFLNDQEVDHYYERYKNRQRYPVKGSAATILYTLKNWVNDNSDGWAHWDAPHRASRKLVVLLLAPTNSSEVTAAKLQQALIPIKALCTRRNIPLDIERLLSVQSVIP